MGSYMYSPVHLKGNQCENSSQYCSNRKADLNIHWPDTHNDQFPSFERFSPSVTLPIGAEIRNCQHSQHHKPGRLNPTHYHDP